MSSIGERLHDAEGREAIRASLDESLLVEAAAGTGKTTELVARVVNVLRAGKATVDGIVAVTFTKKAAGELKLRLRQALDAARRDANDLEKRNLEEAIAHLEDARIGTIHAFCAEILRERPVEARVDPRFEELADSEALALFDRAFDRWMQHKLAELPEGLRRALLRPSGLRESRTAAYRLGQSAWKLIEWRDYATPWRRDPFERDQEIARLLDQIQTLAALSREPDNPKDALYTGTEPVRSFQTRIERARSDYDVLESQLLVLLPELARLKIKGSGKYSKHVLREDLQKLKENLIGDLRAFERRTEADLASLLQQELRSLGDAYEAMKAASGKLDFVDLLVRARDLLKGDVAVRKYFRERFQRIFIDEFQDTDPLQAEILLLLAADDPEETDWQRARPMPGKLFMVGDPKQSIYRFRRADVVLYQKVKDHLMDHGVRVVNLSHSFRANKSIQEALNAAFQPEMAGDRETGQPMYVPLHGGPPAPEDRPSIIALPVPKPHDLRGVNKEEIGKSLPGAVGAFVAWLIDESGWKVRDPNEPSKKVDILPRHVAILFRNYVNFGRDLTLPYSQALESRGVPHILVAGRSFHKRDEVETMRAALAAIEWPDDELSIFATLRGPLFAISDEVLFAFKDALGRLHPFRKIEIGNGHGNGNGHGTVVEALSVLAELHIKRNGRPIAETIGELLAITRAHAGFAMRATGDQVLANVQRVIELARAFEVGGGLSFRGFVEHLDREAESERSSEAPLLEEGAEGVRMMTVHAAKGLEFPIVILADINANLSHRDPDRYLDPERRLFATRILGCMPHELYEHADAERARDRAEGVRLAYVAATRARDILVVPAVGIGERESWYDPLNRAIYPKRDEQRKRERHPGCPVFFGDASIVGEPPQISGMETRGVMPGVHQPRAGTHRVVWWDPQLLKTTAATRFGLRNEPLLAGDEGAEATLAAYDAWKEQRAKSLARGEAWSLAPFAPTEPTAPAPPPGGYMIAELHLPREAGRPSGTRFGTLVHTVLRDIALDATAETVRAMIELHGRMMDASKEECAAAVRPVMSVLAHDVVARARRAVRCHREMPILYMSDGGALLDGTIDLCFLEVGSPEWTVVDFKTDFDPAARRSIYVKQMKWYVAAVSKTFEAPARGVLLSV